MSDGRGILSRFELRPGLHRPRPVRDGAIFLTVLALLMWIAYGARDIVPLPLWPKGGTVVEADFDRAIYVGQDLAPTPVRVGGVNVGKVESVEHLPSGDGVRVRMRIDDEDVNLRRDARASMWERTLLGYNFYIELDPGSPSAPPLGEQPIPMERTQTQVELDEVLTAFDGDARGAVRTFIRELDRGFADPDAVGQAVDRLGPAMRNVGPGAGALRGQRRGDLGRAVTSTSRMMGALARSELELAQLVDSADVAFGVTAARGQDIAATLQQAPQTLQDTQLTMTRLRTTLDQLDPLAESLRPGARRLDAAARALEPTLREAVPLLRDARPLLQALPSAAQDLRGAADSGVPLLDGLQPTVDRVESSFIPWLGSTDDDLGMPVYQLAGPMFAAANGDSQVFDTYGYSARFTGGAQQGSAMTAPCKTYFFDRDSEDYLRCESMLKVFGTLMGGRAPNSRSSDDSEAGR